MTRGLRALHRLIWVLLAAAVGLALALAIAWRNPTHALALAAGAG